MGPRVTLPHGPFSFYYLNGGTIVRAGRDGKWNYASPAWEDLIKPLIARAGAGRHHGS